MSLTPAAASGRGRIPRRVPGAVGIFNLIAKPLLRAGVPMGPDVMLTVPGRRTGLPRSTPVAVAEIAGRNWLIAPFGETDWVLNLRAAGHGTLTSGRRAREFRARELGPEETVGFFRDILEPYMRANAIARWFVRAVDRIPEDPVSAARTNIVFEVRYDEG